MQILKQKLSTSVSYHVAFICSHPQNRLLFNIITFNTTLCRETRKKCNRPPKHYDRPLTVLGKLISDFQKAQLLQRSPAGLKHGKSLQSRRCLFATRTVKDQKGLREESGHRRGRQGASWHRQCTSSSPVSANVSPPFLYFMDPPVRGKLWRERKKVWMRDKKWMKNGDIQDRQGTCRQGNGRKEEEQGNKASAHLDRTSRLIKIINNSKNIVIDRSMQC